MSRAGLLWTWALVVGCGGGQVSVTGVEPDHGPSSGGTLVTVTGLNLGAVESIRIGGAALAELTVVDSTTLTGVTAGAVLWTKQFGTAGDDTAEGVAVDSGGNAYVTGWTRGSFPGFTNAGEEDVVVAKLSTNGVTQWSRQLGSAGADEGRGIALDGTGIIHVTGRSEGNLPGCVSSGQSDMFIARFSSSGRRL